MTCSSSRRSRWRPSVSSPSRPRPAGSLSPSTPHHGCVFCAIVAGAQPAAVVYEDTSTLAFLDITAVTPGHTLVIPKTHATDLWEIGPDDWTSVARTVQRVAQRIGEVLRPDGM